MASAKSTTVGTSAATAGPVEVEPFGSGRGFQITNRHDTAVLWVKTSGTASVAGDDCVPVIGTQTFSAPEGATSVSVSIISDVASTPYTIVGKC